MMRKVFATLAILAMMATPAMAGLHTASSADETGLVPAQGQLGPVIQGGSAAFAGVYTNSPVPAIFYNFSTSATASDIVVVTFAFIWPYNSYAPIVQVNQVNFIYDSNELYVMNVSDAGPFAGGGGIVAGGTAGLLPHSSANYPQNAGMQSLVGVWGNSLFLNPPTSVSSTTGGFGFGPIVFVTGGSILPYLKITFHVNNLAADTNLDAVVTHGRALIPLILNTSLQNPACCYVTDAPWGGHAAIGPAQGVNFVPEPASLSLLGIGIAAIGGGVWRRRRS